MSEAEMLVALEETKAKRRKCERYTEAWAALGYEMARLSEAIRRARANRKRVDTN